MQAKLMLHYHSTRTRGEMAFLYEINVVANFPPYAVALECQPEPHSQQVTV